MTTVLITIFATAILFIIVSNLALAPRTPVPIVADLYSIDDRQFVRSMEGCTNVEMLDGNRIEILNNGDEIYPAMLGAIESAERTITFETYIYWSGGMGRRFAEALSAKAKAGVRVYVLLDWVGSQPMDAELLEMLTKAGAQLCKFNPPRWYTIHRLNNRSHRKLLVIDGKIGFTGGVGVADEWLGNAQDPKHWRDSHFRVAGPVVKQLQAAFLDNWSRMTGAVLHGDDYYPELERPGDCLAHVFQSSPQGGSQSMQLIFLLGLSAARSHLRIATAYFVPDEHVSNRLVELAKSGVKVQVILPGKHSDHRIVRRASRGLWGPLLQGGVEIYEYQPTMFHCKIFIADESLVSVGSTNFDNRSFRLNDEANLNVYDQQFARENIKKFDEDLQQSRQISYKEWARRPLREKIIEHTLALAKGQL